MIAVIGAGAFGSALALAIPGPVRIWGRGLKPGMEAAPRLPDHPFPERVTVCTDIDQTTVGAKAILLAVPMGALADTLARVPKSAAPLIACCKGIDPATGRGPVSVIHSHGGQAAGILTGPSFARDIAAGLPTALTLAMDGQSAAVQNLISGPTLRVYTTSDVRGAEIGGALKNVLAIAAGATEGAGLGQSAQAALITRGFAEICRLAEAEGADERTLLGLSGMGDLMLTAFSDASRNFRYGRALGAGQRFDEDTTVEGVSTSRAVAGLAQKHGLDLPVLSMTDALISGEVTINTAVTSLMSRPLKEE